MKVTGQTDLTSGHRVIKSLLAAGLFLGLLTIFLVPPAELPFPTCAFHTVTGHSCLTCGMTRSLHAISRADLAASLRYHIMGPIVFLGILLGFTIFAAEAISGKRIPLQLTRKRKTQFLVPLAIVWIVYWGACLIAEYMKT
jgi:hypothetical protein